MAQALDAYHTDVRSFTVTQIFIQGGFLHHPTEAVQKGRVDCRRPVPVRVPNGPLSMVW